MARDEEGVARFIEGFALNLHEAGVPRMPARVFALLLTDDEASLSAAEIAEKLQISAAAVSGAVRYLTQVRMAGRERVPGDRRDRYRLTNDLWYEMIISREQILQRWQDGLRDGVQAVDPDTPAGRRLDETARFFAFLDAELPALLDKWRVQNAEVAGAGRPGPSSPSPVRDVRRT